MVGVGLAAGLTGGIYAFSKQELKIERRCLNNSEGMSKPTMSESTANAGYERRPNNMFIDQYEDFEEVREGEPIPSPELLPIEKEKINGMIQGMSEQEIRVVLQNIPVGLMFDEIGARLAMHEQFAMTIQDALKCLPR